MTPDLRQRLYLWSFEETEETKKEDSIPYQLQLLFGRLQLGGQSAVDTRGLTKSFQWDSREAFTQHDVQEFCRVLFDAIERSVKGTPQHNMINELYEGVLIDYVTCQACGTESKREDKYLDVSLAVRNEFDHIYNDSLEKAISNFVRPETLTGANQYQCSKCNSKQNAIKGLRFKSFPKIFIVQLKRFDLDYRTLHKKKINDYVSFPHVLDLNRYATDGGVAEEGKETEEVKQSESKVQFEPPSDFESKTLTRLRYDRHKESTLPEDREKLYLDLDLLAKDYAAKHGARIKKEERQQEITLSLQHGEHVYELFSVMVHSGSAAGGHYYAYIKSFEEDRWYKFNDSSVTEVGEEEIKGTYGGSESRGWVKTSANAYLLAYRKVALDNIMKVDNSLIPPYISDAILHLSDVPAVPEPSKLENMIIICQGQRKTFRASIASKLSQVLPNMLKEFSIPEGHSSEYRVRSYDQTRNVFPDNYEGREESTLEELKIRNYKIIVLEKQTENGQFQEYDPNDVYLKYLIWNESFLTLQQTLPDKISNFSQTLPINKLSRLQDLMDRLQAITGIDIQKLALVRRGMAYSSTQADLISTKQNMRKSLYELRLADSSIMFVEDLGEESVARKWQKEFEAEAYRIVVRFNALDDPPAQTSQDLTHRLIIDSRSNVCSLKTQISSELQLAMDSFIIRRGYTSLGQEIKDLDCKLSQLNLANGSGVFVERGTPIKSDEMRVKTTIIGEPTKSQADGACYCLYDLPSIVISASKRVSDAKDLIVAKATECFPTLGLKVDMFVLREQVHERVGRVLRESAVLKDLMMFEGARFCVHVMMEQVGELTARQILISIKQWHPSTWDLTPPLHLILSKNDTQYSLNERISTLFPITMENLEVFKVNDPTTFTRSKLDKDIWQRLTNKKERIDVYPISLTSDGQLLIVKDKTEPKGQAPVEERKVTNGAGPTAVSSTTFSWKRKEKAIVIKVKGEKQEESA